MATVETAVQAPAPPKRLSLADYDEMTRDGRLGPDDRVELLDGLLVKKMTKGFRHVAVAHRLFVTFIRRLPPGWHSHKEDPIDLPGGPEQGAPSRPEPDLTVRKGPEGTFDNRYPTPADVVLAVEVASNAQMLARDRAGLTRYAWNGVPCVWIVNLAGNVIEVYTRPTTPGEGCVYEGLEVKSPGERIEVPLGRGETVELDVSEILA